MVHSAYDAVELVSGVPGRIEAVASHAGKLLVAASDCSLRIYSAPAPADGEIRRDGPYALERQEQRLWRRAPSAMEASASRDLLLSLSEWVALHRLPGLETVAVVSKTKGANVFAWDDRRGLLAAGRQKRLTVFRLDGRREFIEVKEFGVPDMVKSMAWCGDNICLGIRRDYMIINSVTGALTEVFSSGRIAPPLVVPLPTGELLLGKDNIGVFVDQNGKLIQDGRIIWSDTPASVVIHKPYAVARLPRHVEIRSLRAPSALVQTVVLRDVQKLVQTDNCILAALSNSVYGLLPVPIGAQIVQLTASGEFEDALALCKLLPPEDSNLRAAKESSIHMRQCDPLQEVAFLCRQQVKSSWTVCADVVNRGRRPPCSVGHGLICHWNFRFQECPYRPVLYHCCSSPLFFLHSLLRSLHDREVRRRWPGGNTDCREMAAARLCLLLTASAVERTSSAAVHC